MNSIPHHNGKWFSANFCVSESAFQLKALLPLVVKLLAKTLAIKIAGEGYKLSILLLLLSLTFLTPMQGQRSKTLTFKKESEKEKVARGLHLYSWETEALFDSRQSIKILLIKKPRKLKLAYEQRELKTTSQFASNANALAAVNAGFFNMKEGGSVSYLKVDHTTVNQHASSNKMITTHSIGINEKGRLLIIPHADTQELTKDKTIDDALFTGPLLLQNGRATELPDSKFSNNRHPRTCACVRENRQVLLLTIDGRNAQAQGMSLPELTQLLQLLDCKDGINLDGGGSTTMWIKGRGVVNHPSDNRQFDAKGERKVANVILVH